MVDDGGRKTDHNDGKEGEGHSHADFEVIYFLGEGGHPTETGRASVDRS
jgi:hypothetical protein